MWCPLRGGSDTIQAAARVNGGDAYSNAVVIPWNTGVNQAPVVDAGGAQTVGLSGLAVLNGTVSDDGLPSNTLTITWSKVSGPGTVTFDHPNQAATAARFSQGGNYVLQLSASDGALTTTATVSVSANGGGNWASGWIQSPADKGSVSGLAAVTLVPGITLTGGTLVYYPATNVNDIHTINA